MVVKNNFFKKTVMILVLAVSILKIDLLHAGKDSDELQQRREQLNKLVIDMYTQVPEGKRISSPDFISGSSLAPTKIKDKGISDLVELLEKEAGFGARAWARIKGWCGAENPNSSSFELQLKAVLEEVGANVRAVAALGANPTFIEKQQWLNFISLLIDYKNAKPLSRWRYVTTPVGFCFNTFTSTFKYFKGHPFLAMFLMFVLYLSWNDHFICFRLLGKLPGWLYKVAAGSDVANTNTTIPDPSVVVAPCANVGRLKWLGCWVNHRIFGN